jgi:hypothetical protein
MMIANRLLTTRDIQRFSIPAFPDNDRRQLAQTESKNGRQMLTVRRLPTPPNPCFSKGDQVPPRHTVGFIVGNR